MLALSPKLTLAFDFPLRPCGGKAAPAPDWFTRPVTQPCETPMVEVDGVLIETLAWGRQQAPSLVLVLGALAHAHWLSFIAPFLAVNWRMIALSPSGMGRSGWRWRFDPKLAADFGLGDTWAQLARPSCRLAMIEGALSNVTPAGATALMRAQMPTDTPYISIAGAYHHIMLDRPFELVAPINEILPAQSSPSANLTGTRSSECDEIAGSKERPFH